MLSFLNLRFSLSGGMLNLLVVKVFALSRCLKRIYVLYCLCRGGVTLRMPILDINAFLHLHGEESKRTL